MKRRVIYALVDPDTDVVLYVGASLDAEARLAQHRARPSRRLAPWIEKLKAAGKRPTLHVLERVVARDWQRRERWWIARLRPELNVRHRLRDARSYLLAEVKRRGFLHGPPLELFKRRPPKQSDDYHYYCGEL